MLNKYVIGIDVGGTHTRIGQISASGEVLKNQMLKTADYGDATTFLEHLIGVIKTMISDDTEGFLGIGMGAPSVNEQNQTITYAANLNWDGSLDIIQALSQAFLVPVKLTNDANLLVLAHQHFDDTLLSDFLW